MQANKTCLSRIFLCMLAPISHALYTLLFCKAKECTVEITAHGILCSDIETSMVLTFIYFSLFIHMGVYLSRTVMFLQWYLGFSST